jgi:hypothetical protein
VRTSCCHSAVMDVFCTCAARSPLGHNCAHAAPELHVGSTALDQSKADAWNCCLLQAEQENAVQQGLKAVENGLEVRPR